MESLTYVICEESKAGACYDLGFGGEDLRLGFEVGARCEAQASLQTGGAVDTKQWASTTGARQRALKIVEGRMRH